MRKKIFFTTILATTALFSYEDDELEQHSLWYYHPLHVGLQCIRNGKADCERHGGDIHLHHLGNLHYRKSNAFVSMMLPINRNHIFFPQFQINYVTFDWNKNPKFNETHFYYLQFDLMYYTTALDRWKWIVRFDYNLQTEHLDHPGEYSLYNGLIWGSYQIHRKWHYHIGALGYAGLEGYNIYPIIGADYAPGAHWLIEAIFPMKYSFAYKLSDWSFALQMRPLKERLRCGSREPQHRSIFSYTSLGAEFNIRYERQLKIAVEGYAGYNLGGNFYIKNAQGKKPIYVDLDGAMYGGFSFDYGF